MHLDWPAKAVLSDVNKPEEGHCRRQNWASPMGTHVVMLCHPTKGLAVLRRSSRARDLACPGFPQHCTRFRKANGWHTFSPQCLAYDTDASLAPARPLLVRIRDSIRLPIRGSRGCYTFPRLQDRGTATAGATASGKCVSLCC
jgi:hypothetical protein